MTGDGIFEPIRFSGWPELKETYLANKLEATFILAPLAMSLREQGVPIKIVYLGHRDGTAMMVHKDSTIRAIKDLSGKKVAIPNRFSNQWLIVVKALKDQGIILRNVGIVEMPPPDMPAALFSRSVDAVISGEPFMAQSEMGGYGRVLFLTKDVWPEFISCVLAVPERMIQTRRDRTSSGSSTGSPGAASGSTDRWTTGCRRPTSRPSDSIIKIPKLLRFVLSKPPDRVKYTNLKVVRKDFEEIEALGKEAGVLKERPISTTTPTPRSSPTRPKSVPTTGRRPVDPR